MRDSKFLSEYLNFRKLLHYDLNDKNYQSIKFHYYFQKVVKFFIITDGSMFCWSLLYFLLGNQLYAAVISLAVIAVILVPFNNIGTYVGLLSLIPLLIGFSYEFTLPF